MKTFNNLNLRNADGSADQLVVQGKRPMQRKEETGYCNEFISTTKPRLQIRAEVSSMRWMALPTERHQQRTSWEIAESMSDVTIREGAPFAPFAACAFPAAMADPKTRLTIVIIFIM